MAGLGTSELAGFWVGGKAGRVLHGDAGAIAARIARTNSAAGAPRRDIREMAALLSSDASPRGDASDALRQQMADATIAAMVESA